MLKNNTLLKIISLICAILLWAYVMGAVDPEIRGKVSDVSISVVNQDELAQEGLAVVPGEDMTVDVVIEGSRSLVQKAKKSGMTAYIDVSDCSVGSNTCDIVVNTPNNISVDSMSEETFQIEVEEIVSEEKPVVIEFADDADDAEDGRVPWILSVESESIEVSGAESIVVDVTSVVGTISSGAVSDESGKWVYVPLTAVDKDGEAVEGASVDVESVRVQVALLSLKTVSVDISLANLEDGYEADVSGSVEVEIVGSEHALSEIDEISGTADMTDVTESGEINVELNLPYGVYLYNGDSEVTVTVELTEE